jgi:hypothetical protein
MPTYSVGVPSFSGAANVLSQNQKAIDRRLVRGSAARQTRLPGGKENAMGINEIDHTIYPYTVGREDCDRKQCPIKLEHILFND